MRSLTVKMIKRCSLLGIFSLALITSSAHAVTCVYRGPATLTITDEAGAPTGEKVRGYPSLSLQVSSATGVGASMCFEPVPTKAKEVCASAHYAFTQNGGSSGSASSGNCTGAYIAANDQCIVQCNISTPVINGNKDSFRPAQMDH